MHVLVFITYTTKQVFDAHKIAKNVDKTPNITRNGQKCSFRASGRVLRIGGPASRSGSIRSWRDNRPTEAEAESLGVFGHEAETYVRYARKSSIQVAISFTKQNGNLKL